VQGLPNVDPVYTWVGLAQRVPVRIAIDKVPPGVPLVSDRGRTESLPVEIEEPSLTPGQINPDLAPGMSVSPRNR
jgi:hypothetical protein